MNEASPLVRFNAFGSLTPADLAGLMSLASVPRNLAKGEYLQHEGSRSDGPYLLLQGWTASSMSLPSGARQLLKVHLPGDMIGLPGLPLSSAPDTVTALTAITVSRVPLKALGELFRSSPRVAAMLFLISQEERLLLMDRLTTVGRVDTIGRFAGFVLQLHDRMFRQNPHIGETLNTPLLQADFADLIGVTTAHLNRVVQELRQRGIIRLKGKTLTILDRPALRDLAQLPQRTLAQGQSWLPPSEGVD